MKEPLYDLDEIEDARPPTITVGKTAYMINAEHYDRISAVLDIIAKPGLDKWKRKEGFVKADQLLKEAGRLGTVVHAMIESFCRGVDPWDGFWLAEHDKEPEWIVVQGTRLEPYYRGYAVWHQQNVRQVILLEKTVWSTTHRYAGTFDHFAELTDFAVDQMNAGFEKQELECRVPYGCLALLDNKTSKYLSWTYRLQTAAYRLAILEQDAAPFVDVRGIVHLSSKTPGSCRLFPYPPETDDRDTMVWLGVLDTHRMAEEYESDWRQ